MGGGLRLGRDCNWPVSLDATARHEAYYMRAFCRPRMEGLDEKGLREGLDDLEKAEKERFPGVDPRYVFEKGVHHFLWWYRFEGVESDEADLQGQAPPRDPSSARLAEAVSLFTRAKAILEAQMGIAARSAGRRPEGDGGAASLDSSLMWRMPAATRGSRAAALTRPRLRWSRNCMQQ
jgi:hypothetical protein